MLPARPPLPASVFPAVSMLLSFSVPSVSSVVYSFYWKPLTVLIFAFLASFTRLFFSVTIEH